MLESVLDALPWPVIIFDQQGSPLSINRAACEFAGFAPSDLRRGDIGDGLGRLNCRWTDGRPVTLENWPGSSEADDTTRRIGILLIQGGDGREHRLEVIVTATSHAGADALVVCGLQVPAIDQDWRQHDHDDDYRLLFEHCPDAIFLTRPDGTVVEANPAACEMLGMTNDEIRRVGRSGIVVRDAALAQGLRERAATSKVRAELHLIHKDGHQLVGDTTSVVIDPTSSTSRSFVIVRDVTNIRVAEAEIRERSAYIDAILENALIGFAVNTIDDGVGRFVSRQFETLYGVAPGSMRTVSEYFEKAFRDPVFREEIRPRIMADMASGDPARMRWEALPIITDSGEQRFVTAANIPLLDRNLMVSTVQDVTDRVLAERKLHEQEARRRDAEEAVRERDLRFKSLIETANEAIFVQTDHRFAYANAAALRLFGAKHADQLLGQPVLDRFHPDYREVVRSRIRSLNEEGQAVALVEEVCLRLDGTPVTVEVSASPTVYDGRRGAVVFARDITERKRLEAQFLQAQKMESVGRLAGGVAHDFNNMLSVIIGNAELRLSMTSEGDPGREDLEEIMTAARKSADLTRQLLTFARRQTIRPQVVDLNQSVRSTLAMLDRLIGEDISLAWKPGDDLWTVKVDASQVDQLLTNLVVNSRDAMPQGGRITIETSNNVLDDAFCSRHPGSTPGDYVRLAVSDTGQGIPPEVRRHVFEPFFTTKAIGHGTGLGLATVYGIVKQHGGFIEVYSEVEVGTTFMTWFPRHSAMAVETISGTGAEMPPRGTETILLVEDSEQILKLGRKVLESLGYTVLSTANPVQAIDSASEYQGEIHLLVTDVVMPDMNGRELAARLHAARPRLKVLFMSGYTANVIAHHGVLDEGVNFVQKPFTVRTLAQGVREALDE